MTFCTDCGAVLTVGGYHPDAGPSLANNKIVCLTAQLNHARERLATIERANALESRAIEQMCGKALGYPWFKDDQKNFPGADEADGVCLGEHVTETIVAELVSAYNKLKESVKV